MQSSPNRALSAAILLAGFALLASMPVHAALVAGATGTTAPPGAPARLQVNFTSVAGDEGAIVLKYSFDANEVTPLKVTPDTATKSLGFALDYEVAPGTLSIVLFRLASTALPTGFGLSIDVALAASLPQGPRTALTPLSASNAAGPSGPIAVTLDPIPVTIGPQVRLHSSDTTSDWRISLSELLRTVQLFNLNAFHCDAVGEDGYAPGPGDTTCTPHDSDYDPQDWSIDLSELLRLIQIYNAGGYAPEPTGEDGFRPGPF